MAEPKWKDPQVSNTQDGAAVLLRGPCLDGIERVDRYRQGGYHPVLLNDTFEGGRYRVIHKLGYGGSSTVWLARDNQEERYVALKILCAEEDGMAHTWILHYLQSKASSHPGQRYIGFLDDFFRIQGPNGSHFCLVSGVLGPSLSELMELEKQLRGSVARKVAKQFTQAVAYLHSEDICHGGKSYYPVDASLHLLTLP